METEEQQVEELKKWWKENGSAIVTGVVLGLALLFGGRAWFSWQEREAQQASVLYNIMMQAANQGDDNTASDNAGVLIADYSGTPYASLASMLLARFRIEEGELDAARNQLQWVVDNGGSDVLVNTARLRLARVLADLQDYDAATALLDQVTAEGGQDGLLEEIRGDIHSLRGETQQAAAAYRDALALMTEDYPGRHLVQLKHDHAVTVAALSPEASQ